MDRAAQNMMQIVVKHELPFVEAVVTFRGQRITCKNVLLDTGSAGTIFNVERLKEYESSLRIERKIPAE
jgi:hypothetical protein